MMCCRREELPAGIRKWAGFDATSATVSAEQLHGRPGGKSSGSCCDRRDIQDRAQRSGHRDATHHPPENIGPLRPLLPVRYESGMRTTHRTSGWPKVLAFSGIALFGLVLAYFSTAVATGGIGAGLLGRPAAGTDVLLAGSAMLLVGMAVLATFGYLAVVGALRELRARRIP